MCVPSAGHRVARSAAASTVTNIDRPRWISTDSRSTPRRRSVTLVVRAQRIEHGRRAAGRALHDAEQVNRFGDVVSEEIEVGSAHLGAGSIAGGATGRNACSTHSASRSLGA